MVYLQIAYAAVQRYRLEKRVRSEFVKQFPRKKKTLPFFIIVSSLVTKGEITPLERSVMLKKYSRLSKIIHGAPTI